MELLEGKFIFSIFVLLVLASGMWYVSRIINNPESTIFAGSKVTSFVKGFIKENQFVVATVWFGIVGSVGTTLYYVLRQASDFFTRKLEISLSLNNTVDMFDWFLEYLGKQYALSKSNPNNDPVHVKFLTAPTLRFYVSQVKRNTYSNVDKYGDEHTVKFHFIPDNGFHVFKYKGKIFWMNKWEEENSVQTGFDENDHFKFQSLSLHTFGSIENQKNKQILKELFDEAFESYVGRHTDVTRIFVLKKWSGWSLAMAKRKRPFDSVILHADISQKLLDDTLVFFSKRNWYQEKGIPFRRGYLLYGLPGTGKSSFVTALASRLNLNICVLSLSGGSLDDQRLNARLHDAPSNSIILLEDVDAIFLDRNTVSQDSSGRRRYRQVTFSGLLNAIDGVHSSEDGRLIFMTTNHIEKLDPALLRPGRCDVKMEFTFSTKDQQRKAFERFFPNCTKEQCDQFLNDFHAESVKVSMAQFTEFLCRFRGDVDKIVSTNQAKELASEIREQLEYSQMATVSTDLPIEVWLKRLGLAKYIQKVKSEHIRSVKDITKMTQDNMIRKSFGIKLFGERKRIIRMLNGDKQMIKDFQYATNSEARRIFMDIFPFAKENHAKLFSDMIPPECVSILEIRSYLAPLKAKYLFEDESKDNVISSAIEKQNIENLLLNPPTYHIDLPEQHKQYMTPEKVHLILEKELEYETTRQWLERLNKTYQWWNESDDPNPTPVTQKNEENKKDQNDKSRNKESRKNQKKKENTDDKKGKDDDDNDDDKDDDNEEDDSLPDTLANLWRRFTDNGFSTTELLINLTDSDLREIYKVKQKGRRIKIMRDLKKLNSEQEKHKTMKEEIKKLYNLL